MSAEEKQWLELSIVLIMRVTLECKWLDSWIPGQVVITIFMATLPLLILIFWL